MSRCFPFPPPGYGTAQTFDEAWIQSMKLLKEKEIAKKNRKKQRRQENKEKRKAKKGIEIENEKHGHKRRHKDERYQEDEKRGSHKKMEENGVQHLDKSSLTEDYRHTKKFEDPSDSTESTQNSSKRQKQSSSPEDVHIPGSVIKIRLPLLEEKNPLNSSEVNPFAKQQPCSAYAFGIKSSSQEQCATSMTANTSRENDDSSSPFVFNHEAAFQRGQYGICTSEALERHTKVQCKPSSLDLEIRNLVNVIIPLSDHLANLEEDEDWL